MQGQPLKQGINCNKRKEKVTTKKQNLKRMRKIRIIYSDPDATDCSSDEDDQISSNTYALDGTKSTKRLIKEIMIPGLPKKSSKQDTTRKKIKLSAKAVASWKIRKRSSMFKGVRRRPWEKYVVEIRDPFHKVRLWFGTYGTEEEAAMVYEKKKNEFESLETGLREKNAVEGTKDVFSQPSPSSVLDVTATKASLGDEVEVSIKENVKVETNGEELGNVVEPVSKEDEDESIQHLLEEPTVPSLAGGQELNLEGMEDGEMLFGNGFDYSLDDFNGGSIWDFEDGEDGEASGVPPVDSALDDKKFDWIEETLKGECASSFAVRE